jgi:hypothetical protein
VVAGQQQLRGAVPARDNVLSHEVALRAAQETAVWHSNDGGLGVMPMAAACESS